MSEKQFKCDHCGYMGNYKPNFNKINGKLLCTPCYIDENNKLIKISKKTIIYCFVNGKIGDKLIVKAVYIDDLGYLNELVSHASHNLPFAKRDIGFIKSNMGNYSHKIYEKNFPDGYELKWVKDLTIHPILKKFLEIKLR